MYIKDFSKKHHDEISSVFNVICTKNEKIPYSKAEKKIETKISSNNMEVLKLYNYLDFRIDNIHNVFVKVINN